MFFFAAGTISILLFIPLLLSVLISLIILIFDWNRLSNKWLFYLLSGLSIFAFAIVTISLSLLASQLSVVVSLIIIPIGCYCSYITVISIYNDNTHADDSTERDKPNAHHFYAKIDSTAKKIPCEQCSTPVLPYTAYKNNGLCCPCAKHPSQRKPLLIDTSFTPIEAQFDTEHLFSATLLISIFGLLLSGNDNSAILVPFSAGFIYSIVLFQSLIKKPGTAHLVQGVIILTITNILALFSFAILAPLPTYLIIFLAYLPGNILGAIITFMLCKYLWSVNYTKEHLKIVLKYIIIGSFLVPFIRLLLPLGSLAFTLNSILWWLFFTRGIIKIEKRAKVLVKLKNSLKY